MSQHIHNTATEAAACEGCGVKVRSIANDPDDVPAYRAAKAAEIMFEMYQKGVDPGVIAMATEGYPHDGLPFHNVFDAVELREQLTAQNELLAMLQTQRDAYKARLDALMKDGLLVDKTRYRIEFAEETEIEVRVRLVEIA